MRVKAFLTGAALSLLGLAASLAPAAAFDWDPSRAPERPEVIEHRVYRPNYIHVYRGEDPYKYRYARRAYYPDASSNYWVPASEMRMRYRYTYDGPKYRYQPSWGYNPNPHEPCQPAACRIMK